MYICVFVYLCTPRWEDVVLQRSRAEFRVDHGARRVVQFGDPQREFGGVGDGGGEEGELDFVRQHNHRLLRPQHGVRIVLVQRQYSVSLVSVLCQYSVSTV
jgi:hypothetical protein